MSDDTVWTIESGEYSDYSVLGVYTTKENAETVVAAIHDKSELRIVERPLNPSTEEIRAGYNLYDILMASDGTVEKCNRVASNSYSVIGRCWWWSRSTAPRWKDKNWYVWAKDDKHAIKIVNEYRVQHIAEATE